MDKYHLKLDAPWDEVKERLKEVQCDLTDDDLDYQPGDDQRFLEKLAAKLNKDVFFVKGWIESVSYNKGIAG